MDKLKRIIYTPHKDAFLVMHYAVAMLKCVHPGDHVIILKMVIDSGLPHNDEGQPIDVTYYIDNNRLNTDWVMFE